jgi:hypothetical protein
MISGPEPHEARESGQDEKAEFLAEVVSSYEETD